MRFEKIFQIFSNRPGSFRKKAVPRSGICSMPIFRQYVQPDYAHCLCFVPKHTDDPLVRKESSHFGSPRFGTKLQSFAINLSGTYCLKIRLRECPFGGLRSDAELNRFAVARHVQHTASQYAAWADRAVARGIFRIFREESPGFTGQDTG